MLSISNKDARDYCKGGDNTLAASVAYSFSTSGEYTSAPTVSFSGGGGSGAAATAVVVNGRVVGITITAGGTGYTSAPTISFSGGGGTGAAATASISSGAVVSATVTNGGTGQVYTFTDNTSYASGDSRAAVNISVFDAFGNKREVQIPSGSSTATLPLAGNKVATLSITAAGTGYTSAPTVTITGGGGSGATAVAYINDDGEVSSIELTSGGVGYTSAPTVTLSGGGGSGATVTSTIATDEDLDRTEGISMIATVVSDKGKIKDGSVHKTFTDTGNFTMEA